MSGKAKAPTEEQSAHSLHGTEQRQRIADLYNQLGGNISAIARAMGLARATIQDHIRRMGGISKPLVGGRRDAMEVVELSLPRKGTIQRYILTSAQNNTKVNLPVWDNLLALAEHYNADVFVGTFSYNQNAYGPLAVKQGTEKRTDGPKQWFARELEGYVMDKRAELAHGLVWCGEMNILPTAEDPLSGLETYTSRKSAIFPHVKVSMRSIATMKGEGTKFNYTTGTVTQRNYIQKKAGLKAEHHHSYAAMLVEVNSDGNWWVRQLEADSQNRIQDLDVVAKDGKVTTGNRVEAITWGDLHATILDGDVEALSLNMLEVLKPKVQFIHDLMEGVSTNHHQAKDPHAKFKAYLRGYHAVETEVTVTAKCLSTYADTPGIHTVVVDSNHDNWLARWLREHDYRLDPRNAMFFLEAQLETYRQLEGRNENFHLIEWAMQKAGVKSSVQFLRVDQSFTICNKRIECGMHGHLGPDGARGTPGNLNKVGRRANTAHTHSAGIFNGLYVAGTSSKLIWDYAKGPSSWSHSHVLTYPNGMRTIVTMYGGRWRA